MYVYRKTRQNLVRLIALVLLAAHSTSGMVIAGERLRARTGEDVHHNRSTNRVSSVHGGTASPSIEVLALTGDPTPDGQDGYGFNSNWVALSDGGEVAFATGFVGPFGTNGLFKGAYSALIQVARSGEESGAGHAFYTLIVGNSDPYPAVNASGLVAFNAKVSPFENSRIRRHAIFVGDGCRLDRVVLDGDPAPNGGEVYPPRWPVNVNARGQVSFSAVLAETLGGSADDQALFRWDGPGIPLVEIVRKGDDTPDGAGTFTASGSAFSFSSPEINDVGQVAFVAAIGGYGASGIYRGSGGPLTEIARIGDLAPGGGTYAAFRSATSVAMNNAGEVAFLARLNTVAPGVQPSGVYVSDGSTVIEVARGGDSTPNGNGYIAPSDRYLDLNEDGEVAFLSNIFDSIDGSSNRGLLVGDGDSLTMVARLWQSSPGGGYFTDFYSFSINDAGQVAFRARVSLDFQDGDASNDETGIYMFDPDTGLHLVARTGMPLLDTTIHALRYAGTSHSNGTVPIERNGFNNAGEVAFSMQLTDHNGVEGIAVWRLPRDPADFDGNGAVEPSDALALIECLTGPVDQVAPCCAPKDLDGDDDVDLLDFASFQVSLAGF